MFDLLPAALAEILDGECCFSPIPPCHGYVPSPGSRCAGYVPQLHPLMYTSVAHIFTTLVTDLHRDLRRSLNGGSRLGSLRHIMLSCSFDEEQALNICRPAGKRG